MKKPQPQAHKRKKPEPKVKIGQVVLTSIGWGQIVGIYPDTTGELWYEARASDKGGGQDVEIIRPLTATEIGPER